MAKTKHVADASERVNGYFETMPAWSRTICEKLRKIVMKSDPAMIEDWKWGPNYYCDGVVCWIAGFQKFVNLTFFQGVMLKDKRKILLSNPGTLHNRHIRFTDIKQIDEDVILEYLMEAIDNNRKGKVLKISRDKTVEVPPDVKKAFKAAGILGYFESLAFSHRKEYVRWINDAKKEETRINRIQKAISKLGEQEMLHDKYKKSK